MTVLFRGSLESLFVVRHHGRATVAHFFWQSHLFGLASHCIIYVAIYISLGIFSKHV